MVSCSKCRYQYELLSGDITSIESEEVRLVSVTHLFFGAFAWISLALSHDVVYYTRDVLLSMDYDHYF